MADPAALTVPAIGASTAHFSLDAAVLATLTGTLFGYLPTLAYLVPIIWYMLQMVTWLQDQKAKRAANRLIIAAATIAATKLLAEAQLLAAAKAADAVVAAKTVSAAAVIVAAKEAVDAAPAPPK